MPRRNLVSNGSHIFRWDSTVDRFLFLLTMSSTSSDSEMSFDSEGSGIYISLKWKPKRMTTHAYQHRKLNSNDDDGKAVISDSSRLSLWSQQNPFLSLKIQASSEIMWFEMLRTDHRTHFACLASTRSTHLFERFGFSSG